MAQMEDLFDTYTDQNRMYHFEGTRGVSNLNKIVTEVCGYNSAWSGGNNLETFLQDNPGAIEAVINWIRESHCPEWRNNLEQLVTTGQEDDQE